MKATVDPTQRRSRASAPTVHRTSRMDGPFRSRWQALADSSAVVAAQARFQSLADSRGRAAPRPGIVQRAVDLSAVAEYPLLYNAIYLFHRIEQEDLTREEFDALKTEHQRFMPLLGRFATARGTTLQVTPGRRSVVGDLALTTLMGVTDGGTTLDYDDDREAFQQHAADRAFTSFVIRVAFNTQRITGQDTPGTMRSVGTLLQAFTHEVSVHAENMLDYVERYWDRYDAGAAAPAPLGTSSEEHAAFREGRVSRYEYMSARAKALPGAGQDFGSREVNDRFTAV